ILEPSFFPNCISDPTKVPPFEGPPYTFVHREGGYPRPRHLPCHILMRRNPIIITATHVIILVIIAISPSILSILLLQYLRPIRYIHRHRRRHPIPTTTAAATDHPIIPGHRHHHCRRSSTHSGRHHLRRRRSSSHSGHHHHLRRLFYRTGNHHHCHSGGWRRRRSFDHSGHWWRRVFLR
ncbi:hypothetical protein Leryth_011323, partial [Lithospermum erythrorhizon]